MAATVTLSTDQLRDLLQEVVTTEISSLRSNLEETFEEKLQAKFDEAELNMKQFMKESIEDEDPEDPPKNADVTQELKFLKDHVLQMEQSVSRIVISGESSKEMDTSIHSMAASVGPSSGALSLPSTGVSNTQSAQLEKVVTDCCIRLEEIVNQRTSKWEQQQHQPTASQSQQQQQGSGRPNPRRTQSMDGSGTPGAVSVLRASQQHMEDLLETRLKAMEQFIDNRHAELEAYYSSSNDTLRKIVLESVQGISPATSKRGSNGGNVASVPVGGQHPLTKEDLEAVLDARISAEEAEGTRPLTKDELEAILDARISAEEMETPKPLTREELETVLDARISAEEEEEEEEKRTRQTQEQEPAQSTSSSGGKPLHLAMEKLIQQQQEWINIQSSTHDLEQQVQLKLDQIEGSDNSPSSLQRIESKLESLEKLALAAVANSPRKKQRSSSKKPSRKLSQGLPTRDSVTSTSKSRAEDSSTNVNTRACNAYSDISVDDQGVDEDENDQKEQGGDRVKTFMNTLSNWKHLNEEQEDVRDYGVDDNDNDIDEGDDDIDSMDMSVDSSVPGGAIDEDKKAMQTLHRLESKLDQLEEKIRTGSAYEAVAHQSLRSLDGGATRERSTNARHSREIVENTIRQEHTKLKKWILEKQDVINNSGRSEPGQAAADVNNSSRRAATESPASTAAVDPKALQSLQDKLDTIENTVSTNQSLLQDQRRQAVPPVPKELPLVQPLGGSGTLDLERKILSHLDNMDKSVQFKLDEIYAEIQPTVSRRDSDRSTMSKDDQSAIIAAIEKHLEQLRESVIEHLKASIPDYGMAKSMLGENLEELRQIVSEVAISEVELLKTQLGVAEEAEQEALHAILVLREQMEESKESKEINKPRPAPQSQAPEHSSGGGLWNLGQFGELLGQQLRPNATRFQSRNLSIGQQSAMSGSASRGMSYSNGIASNVNKYRSPKQKLEDWKNEIQNLDDKATDLRTFYSQLRGQEAGERMGQGSVRPHAEPVAAESSLKTSTEMAAGETKEMELNVQVVLDQKGSSVGDGDWI